MTQAFRQFAVNNPPAGQYPTQVVFSTEGGSVLLFNSSTTVPVFVSHTPVFNLATGDYTDIQPQSSVVFDGSQDVYAVTAPGFTTIIKAYPSATQFTQAIGVTPLASIGSLAGSPGASIPGMTSYSLQPNSNSVFFDVTQFSSYDFNLFAVDATGAVPAIQVSFKWYDDLVSGIPVFEEDWWVWTGSLIPYTSPFPLSQPMAGNGPMHGQYLTVNISNPHATTPVTLQYANLFGSTRTVPQADWRQNSIVVKPVISGETMSYPTDGYGFDNDLGLAFGVTVASGARVIVPFCLYAGAAYLRFSASLVSVANPVIATMDGQALPIASGVGNRTIIAQLPADTNDHEPTLILPRKPCYLLVAGAASGTLSFTARLIAQQVA